MKVALVMLLEMVCSGNGRKESESRADYFSFCDFCIEEIRRTCTHILNGLRQFSKKHFSR